jgi:hypothetical protein
MTSIRKLVYAAVLALTTLNFAPTFVHAQDTVRGEFTLARDVHWQKTVVPAGNYRFSLKAQGATGMLVVRKFDSKPAGFMFLVRDTESARSSDRNRILLEDTPQGTYVSTMQLPEFGMTLRFPVPDHTKKQMARAAGTRPQVLGQ